MGVKRTVQSTINARLSIDELFSDFLAEKQALNLAPETIGTYRKSFVKFKKALPDADGISQKMVLDFVENLQQEDITAVTINHYLRHIKTFLYWCMERGHIQPFKIKLLREQETVVETYSETELVLLLRKPKTKTDFREWRSWAIINWVMATGNRAKSIRNVHIEDVDFYHKEIRLTHTKSRRAQLLPLSPALEACLKEYMRLWRRNANQDEFLFCSVEGGQLTASSLCQSTRKYNLARGVTKTSLHALRHTFAKQWILNTGDVFKLQKLLGHSSLEMTKHYVNMFDSDLKQDFGLYSPLDTISSKHSRKHVVKRYSGLEGA